MASSRKFLKSKFLELDKIKARHGRETYETDGADHRPGCGTDSDHPRPPATPGYPGGCPPFKILKNLELIFRNSALGSLGVESKIKSIIIGTRSMGEAAEVVGASPDPSIGQENFIFLLGRPRFQEIS